MREARGATVLPPGRFAECRMPSKEYIRKLKYAGAKRGLETVHCRNPANALIAQYGKDSKLAYLSRSVSASLKNGSSGRI